MQERKGMLKTISLAFNGILPDHMSMLFAARQDNVDISDVVATLNQVSAIATLSMNAAAPLYMYMLLQSMQGVNSCVICQFTQKLAWSC